MEALKARLAALVTDETAVAAIIEKAQADGVKDSAGAAVLTVEDWQSYGMAKVPARQLVAELTKPAPVAAAPVALPSLTAASLLPSVPEDEEFLKLLQVGGVLKVEPKDVMSAVRVMFAQDYGLFRIEEALLNAMEVRSEELDEPWPQVFYDIQRSLTRKKHADVFAALDISSARVFTEAKKNAFFARLQGIWGTLGAFNGRVDAWQTAWLSKVSNPAVLMTSMAAFMSGGGASGAMSGMTDAPDSTPILNAARGVIDKLNKMFAGPGIPIARALAADALQLRQILEKPELIAATGAATREEMLRKLGLSVDADVVDTSRAVTQYVLAVMKITEVPVPQLPMYIGALRELGANIPWDTLGSVRASNGTRSSTRERGRDGGSDSDRGGTGFSGGMARRGFSE